MKVNIEIADQDIIDVLCTALEGGSNYWYFLPELSDVLQVTQKDCATSARIGKAVMEKDIVIPVHDLEDESEHLGDISKQNIERGLRLFLQEGRQWDAAMDADQADVFFQYVVMGEIVFG